MKAIFYYLDQRGKAQYLFEGVVIQGSKEDEVIGVIDSDAVVVLNEITTDAIQAMYEQVDEITREIAGNLVKEK